MNNFEAEARGAVLDLTGDSASSIRMKKNAMKWDVKKKKYVRADANEKKKIKMSPPFLLREWSIKGERGMRRISTLKNLFWNTQCILSFRAEDILVWHRRRRA